MVSRSRPISSAKRPAGSPNITCPGLDGERRGVQERAAAAGAEVLAFTGDRDADAGALAGLLDGDAPGLVLDFLWGSVAEAAFRALTRRGLGEDAADIKYVQIGALAGADAPLPAGCCAAGS
jgi:hypothetical protein